MPIGAYASVEYRGGTEPLLTLTGMVGTPDGTKLLKEQAIGTDPELLGLQVADKLISQGAERILAEVRE
ncbi:porphobilinogen deaminase [compost metagenome]